jgi:starch-binding outer membrane protein, SusD/RagB family
MIMLRKSIYAISTGLTLIAFSSCEKTVDKLPSDSINQAIVFQTVTDLEQGLNAVYGSWAGDNSMYVNAIVADEAKISNENRGQGQFEFKWQYVPSQGGAAAGGWTSFYYTIGIANKILAVIDEIKTTTSAQQTRRDQIKGELLGLRGAAHFELLQRFCGRFSANAKGIPYTLTSDISARPSRLSMAEVLRGIETDLAAAKSSPLNNAPVATGTAGSIYLSKSAIAGYQARVALYKGDWTAAAAFASEAITFGGKGLATAAQFPTIWTDDSEAEVIWKQRRTGTGVGTLWQDNNGDVFFEPSDKLKALYNRTTDVRFNAYFLIAPTAQDTCLVKKFFSSARGPKIVDIKSMRVAEFHLIRAEARAELGDLTGAAADFNLLGAARISGYSNVTFASKTEAIDAIMNERARELCFEGFRFFDHVRRGLPITRPASDVQSSTWQTLPASDYRMLFPIPQASILSNPNMEQNPGY